MHRTKATFEVPEWYGVLSKTGIPLCRCILAAKEVRRKILDDDESIVCEDRWQDRSLYTFHVADKCHYRLHHGFVRCIGSLTRLRWLRLRRQKRSQQQYAERTGSPDIRPGFHGVLLRKDEFLRFLNVVGTAAGRKKQ